mgnify:CR=1 FL=1
MHQLKNRLFLHVSLFLMIACAAQVTMAPLPQDALRWSQQRPITWDDFLAKPVDDGQNGSEILIQSPSFIKKSTLLSKPVCTVDCFMDRRNSWALKSKTNDDLLRYNQVLFNIYELHARKLRREFATASWPLGDPTALFNDIGQMNNNELMTMVQQFRAEYKFSNDKDAVNKWYAKIGLALSELEEFGTK